MLHPETVHLARELFAELVEQILAQELLLERLENSRLDLVAPDGEAVVASAFLAGTETCEPIAAGHDEPSAADAALREPGEAAWASEVNRRVTELDSGAVKTIPRAEVRRRLAAR